MRQPLQLIPFWVHEDAWAKITPDLQKTVESVSVWTMIDCHAHSAKLDMEALEKFKAYGTIVEPASAEIVAELERQAEIFYQEMAAKDPFFAEVLESKLSFMEKVREGWERF